MGILASIGSFLASNPQLIGTMVNTGGQIASAALGKGLSGFYGQESEGSSSQYGQSESGGSGHSQSGSTSGTNDQQIADWLSQAYNYQSQMSDKQGNYNWKSMLTQMGYNTLSAIQQGIYNHIENNAAMQYNSAEAAKNREWQEEMSSTAYQRAVEDMKKAGLNPILAYANGGASTPGGSAGTISAANMGLASSSAASVGLQHGFVPSSYSSESWSTSDWYNFAQSFTQAASQQHSSPKQLAMDLTAIEKAGKEFKNKVQSEIKPKTGGAGRNEGGSTKPQNKTGAYGEKRKPGDYLK